MTKERASKAGAASAAKSTEAARLRFMARLDELGATLLDEWQGTRASHRVRCAAGHECTPKPDGVIRGSGVCGACAGNSPKAAEAKFRAAVVLSGGEVLGPYQGVNAPVKVRCSNGHEVEVRPSCVRAGQGICRGCAGKTWDVFYVVAGSGLVKFGITSGNPAPRLADHRRNGLDRQLFLRDQLPDGHARNLELTIMNTLDRMGYRPVRGREFFPTSCVNLILNLVTAALPD